MAACSSICGTFLTDEGHPSQLFHTDELFEDTYLHIVGGLHLFQRLELILVHTHPLSLPISSVTGAAVTVQKGGHNSIRTDRNSHQKKILSAVTN